MASTAQDLVRKHRLTVADYRRMAEAGILDEETRVELIDGEIIDMSPIGSPHAGTVNRLIQVFGRAIGQAAVLSVQNPVILGEFSEPEPDIALLRPRNDFYTSAHPGPEDVLLIVEVSQSSLRHDREVKIPLYARHRIPEVWLVDVDNKRLGLFHTLGNDAYRNVVDPIALGTVTPQLLPQVPVDLSGLF